MKRTSLWQVFAATGLTCISLGAAAQSLDKIAPLPAQWGAWSAWFFDTGKGFLVGNRRELFRTLDGGATWNQISIPGDPAEPFYDVSFFDGNVGIVSGNSTSLGPDVFRTTDGGATWQPVAEFPLGGSWYHQDFVSSTTGFIGSNGALVRSTNGGLNWGVRSAYPTCPSLTGMDFRDANFGLGTGGLPNLQTGVFKTADGGATWQLRLAGAAEDVVFLGGSQWLAMVDNQIVRSDNDGNTWFPTGGSIPTGLIDLERINSQTVVGVSAGGDLWRTADGGFHWSHVYVGEGDLPGNWKVRFANSQIGVAVGPRDLLYRTQDGGLTWSRMGRGAAFEINALAGTGNDEIVAAGHHGIAQRLPIAGPWDYQVVDAPSFGRDTNFSALAMVGGDFLYAVGHWGSTARSVDGGRSWLNLTGNLSFDYYALDVAFTDPLNGWVTGWDYTIGPKKATLRTHDGGVTWDVAPNANFDGVAVEVNKSRIWIQSLHRNHWRSTDGGATFSEAALPDHFGINPTVSDMSFATPTLGYVAGFDGYLVRTEDGGRNWTALGAQTIDIHILGVLARGDEVWICGARTGGGSAFIRRSLDRGQTWQSWYPSGQYTTPHRMVRTKTNLYAAGYNGEIWRVSGLPKLSLK